MAQALDLLQDNPQFEKLHSYQQYRESLEKSYQQLSQSIKKKVYDSLDTFHAGDLQESLQALSNLRELRSELQNITN